ncbi:hypothetical protein B0J11DRAFT_597324 [Dendryphion nanum]|uniref:Uncharacterized protein n=1 Tax=Dendryphion nanum TaxID=256645 RepID=A0A9P9ECV7_9PLEO|nr:hypothetical protein B0J11DRAFT_597324 [Dendryphion nanum]
MSTSREGQKEKHRTSRPYGPGIVPDTGVQHEREAPEGTPGVGLQQSTHTTFNTTTSGPAPSDRQLVLKEVGTPQQRNVSEQVNFDPTDLSERDNDIVPEIGTMRRGPEQAVRMNEEFLATGENPGQQETFEGGQTPRSPKSRKDPPSASTSPKPRRKRTVESSGSVSDVPPKFVLGEQSQLEPQYQQVAEASSSTAVPAENTSGRKNARETVSKLDERDEVAVGQVRAQPKGPRDQPPAKPRREREAFKAKPGEPSRRPIEMEYAEHDRTRQIHRGSRDSDDECCC